MPLTNAYFSKLDIQDEIVGFLKSSYAPSQHMVFLVEVNNVYGSFDSDDYSLLLVYIVALLVDDDVPLRGINAIILACLFDFFFGFPSFTSDSLALFAFSFNFL